MPTCKGCGLEILWAKTERGANVPLDPHPVQIVQDRHGPLRVFKRIGGDVVTLVRGRPLQEGESQWDEGVVEGYVSHHATCVKADDFKTRLGKGGTDNA